MKKKHPEPKEQLNMQFPMTEEPETEYSLEEIMREFGGWSKSDEELEPLLPPREEQPEPLPLVVKAAPKPEPVPEPIPTPEPPAEKPVEPPAPQPPRQPEPPRPKFSFINVKGDALPVSRPYPEPKRPEPAPQAEPPKAPESPAAPAKAEQPEEDVRRAEPKVKFSFIDMQGEALEPQKLREQAAPKPESPQPEPTEESRPRAEPEQASPEENVRTELPKKSKMTFSFIDMQGETIQTRKEEEDPASPAPDLSGDTIPFRPVTEEDLAQMAPASTEPVEMPEEPRDLSREQLKEEARARKREERRLHTLERQRRKAQKQALRTARREQPELVYPSPQDACKAYAKVGTLRLRLGVCALLTLASVVLVALCSYSIAGFSLADYRGSISVALVAMLLVQSLLTYDVFVRGIYQALQLRFDLMSLLTVLVLVTVAESFVSIGEQRLPFCATAAVAELLALWSIALERRAKWRTLKTVLSMNSPVAAVKEEKAWHGLDCIFRQEGSLQDFTAMLETPDAAQKVMRVYAPAALGLTLVLAAFAAWSSESSFLWAWTVLLTAALPVGGFIACVRPFAILAGRLHKAGAAICGWRGAKLLSGESGIVIRDRDLFPKHNIAMNGMKMYSDLPTRQVIGYATAVIQAAGSGLLPLFEEIMKNENGIRYTADSFRQYEGGGLGAEIRGDVVLLGSLPFMRLMGVYVPEGIRVQSAVYISVNKELVGIFALNYAPANGTKLGLGSVLRSKGLTPILATRDFMITPALVRKRYKIPADRVEFPVVAERIQLSAPEAGKAGQQGALMAKGSFLSFASAVAGGRILRRTVHAAVGVSLLSGILGMVLLCLLTYLGSTIAASAVNLLIYQLLWQIPVLLITGLIGKT